VKYQPTSREAWRAFIPVAAELDRAICEYLHRNGPSTCQDIELALDRSHQSVSGNLRHLVENGLVEASGDFGKTKSGRRANLWQIRVAPPEPPARKATQLSLFKDRGASL